jgi:hypothetical protein
MDDDDNIKKLPVRFKQPPQADPPFLSVVTSWGDKKCDHRSFYADGHMRPVTYKIREGETEVECGNCGTRVDPMFVLRILANEENSWSRSRQGYIEEMKRLKERSRTKCVYCGKMTEISRR